MQVLIIAPTPYFSDRGCHIRIASEIQELLAAGHQATVYTYPLGRDVGAADIVRVRPVPWYRRTDAGPNWHKFYLDIMLLWKILRTARARQFNLIHAHLHEGGVIGWIVARRWRLPLVVDLQSQLSEELTNYGWCPKPVRWLVNQVEKFILQRADWVYVSSPRALALLKR